MKLLNVLITLALIAGVNMAHAQKKKAARERVSTQSYGMAGCGLGSIVFGDKPGMIQVVAATLNGTGVQTFGISTGTSNCSEGGIMARANQFIEVNKVALENDLARGTGESIASLGQVLGCQNTDFATQFRTNYNQGATVEQMSETASQACKL